MIPTARRQRIAEALAAYHGAARRVHLLLGSRVVPTADLQVVADSLALVHRDTPELQAARRAALERDVLAYEVGRPMRRTA